MIKAWDDLTYYVFTQKEFKKEEEERVKKKNLNLK